ncbi:MAG: hypothetical protein ACK4PK_09760 [Alphaproteobacteria bacterium]
MKAEKNSVDKIASRIFSGTLAMLVVVALGFASGYNSVTSYNNMCHAQVTAGPVTVAGGLCACCKTCVTPCEPTNTASGIRDTIYNSFNTTLEAAATALENILGLAVDTMVQKLLEKINDIEKNMIQWWQTMWHYNLNPSLRAMTVQMNTANADLNKSYQASVDAEHSTQHNTAVMRSESRTARVVRDNVCPPAGLTGGAGRGKTFARAMRKGWQTKAINTGAQVMGEEGARGVGEYLRSRNEAYEAAFCDPAANGGTNVCGAVPSPAEFHNADTQITKFIYNKLTIPVDDDTATTVVRYNVVDPASPIAMSRGDVYERAIKENIENLIGVPMANPINAEVAQGPQGRQIILNRRDYLAKYNALRSVPQLIIGDRMPGSQLGTWIRELREEAGIPMSEISDNPSYREVINAIAVDRFNSGKFANGLQMERTGVEMEKLSMATFYLMLLHDYHKLLERQTLTLAVQVSILADDVKLPRIDNVSPVRN